MVIAPVLAPADAGCAGAALYLTANDMMILSVEAAEKPLNQLFQGLTTGTPAARNGAVSRVATANPWTAAMAAICPSATEME